MTKSDKVYAALVKIRATSRDKTLLGLAIERIIELQDRIDVQAKQLVAAQAALTATAH